MKLYSRKLREIVLEEVKKVLVEETKLSNVYQFLKNWDRNKPEISKWAVSKVGDKIEVHGSGPRWSKDVRAVVEPMGSLSGVYKVSGDKNFANELYNSIKKNLSNKDTPQIVGP